MILYNSNATYVVDTFDFFTLITRFTRGTGGEGEGEGAGAGAGEGAGADGRIL